MSNGRLMNVTNGGKGEARGKGGGRQGWRETRAEGGKGGGSKDQGPGRGRGKGRGQRRTNQREGVGVKVVPVAVAVVEVSLITVSLSSLSDPNWGRRERVTYGVIGARGWNWKYYGQCRCWRLKGAAFSIIKPHKN